MGPHLLISLYWLVIVLWAHTCWILYIGWS